MCFFFFFLQVVTLMQEWWCLLSASSLLSLYCVGVWWLPEVGMVHATTVCVPICQKLLAFVCKCSRYLPMWSTVGSRPPEVPPNPCDSVCKDFKKLCFSLLYLGGDLMGPKSLIAALQNCEERWNLSCLNPMIINKPLRQNHKRLYKWKYVFP